MSEPNWIARSTVDEIHAESLAKYGGADGIRDAGLLESAILRPKNLWHYSEPKPEIAALASSLAYGIAKNHPFADGNKRTAWVVGRLMLQVNGCDVAATQEEKIEVMLALAASESTEDEFTNWIRDHLVARK